MGNERKAGPLTLFRNPVSWVGLGVAAVATLIGVPMMLVDVFAAHTNPYAGIFTYLILPGAATIGIVVAVIGAFIERARRRRNPSRTPMVLPTIDLNQRSHRAAVAGVVAACGLGLVLITVTMYQAYHFSDSVEFCGAVCHEVMKPEYTAYQHSPHARVSCVECHIGSGVDWFVKSKITGAYQVYSVAFDKFHRPIETPIKDLRPAEQTCARCHWPEKFFGAQQKTFNHFLADEQNTPWAIQTLLRIGGGDPRAGAASGIHWHMNIKNKIEFIDVDGKRQSIPWVRSTDPTGKVTEYMSTETPIAPSDIGKYPIRKMDCMDCHNRPSHVFDPPNRAIDRAFEAGRMDRSLPYLKREGMRLMAAEYKTEKEAKEAIAAGLSMFYDENYPKLAKEKSASVLEAAQTLQHLYSINIFPEMKADWRAYPNHISHLQSDGCFRCHDGMHVSKEGKVITNDCNACHTILAQGSPDQVAKARLQAQPFQHPVDLGMDVTTMKCSVCHTGTTGL